jgi:hypothetical protein
MFRIIACVSNKMMDNYYCPRLSVIFIRKDNQGRDNMKKHRRLLSILAIAVTLIAILLFLPIFMRSETCLPGVSANNLSGIEPFLYPYPYPFYPYPLPDHYCKYFPQVYSGLNTGPTLTFTFTRIALVTITRFPSRTPTIAPYRTFMPTATCSFEKGCPPTPSQMITYTPFSVVTPTRIVSTVTRQPSKTPTTTSTGYFPTPTPRPTNSPIYLTRTATNSFYPAPPTETSKP